MIGVLLIVCCCLLLHLCFYVQACALLIQYDITPEIGLARLAGLLKGSCLKKLAGGLYNLCSPRRSISLRLDHPDYTVKSTLNAMVSLDGCLLPPLQREACFW